MLELQAASLNPRTGPLRVVCRLSRSAKVKPFGPVVASDPVVSLATEVFILLKGVTFPA